MTVVVNPTSIPADGASHSTATATVKNDRAAIPNALVTWKTSGDVTFSNNSSCTTVADGTCSVTITASTTADTETITATSGGKSGTSFFSSRRRHTRCLSDWSSDVCSSD